ncbi:carbohydrate ABC transporter permease [Microbacterium sp. RURRCA19A]|uniref:carbohydrate ABC transporter permease n=1 Tax=Microbacterium sp. RURRCA19A TaxID=1907391 RepID=UPI000956BB08|nr:sugar ABC transporter permease [Microbacterium sp. RURRCA19A]SIS16910.1 multiple sugar transport system permease protein [Microbacterium sp. RURRCA19A]
MTRVLSVPVGVPAREARGGLLPRVQRWARSGGLWSLAFGAPLVLVFAYFSWGPIVRGLVLSFQKTNFLTSSWVGLHNFEYVLTDPVLPRAILNTVLFTAIGLLVGAPLPLALAVVMSELRRWKGLYSALAYLPVVIPPVVAILLWKVLYMPGPSGLLNSLLGTVGLGPLAWLDSEQLVIPSMVLAATWAGAGTSVIIYLAALGGVRPDLYEAAELDGAGVWSRVWHVTLPQIRGVILVLILLQLIGTMQVFNEPKLLTGGGPNNASISILMLIYQYGFVNSNYGAAAALSVMLAAVLAIVSIVFQFSTRRLNEND